MAQRKFGNRAVHLLFHCGKAKVSASLLTARVEVQPCKAALSTLCTSVFSVSLC
jgi:hypothetical protein